MRHRRLKIMEERIAVAKEYYNYAQSFQDLGKYWLASRYYLKATIACPIIGNYYCPIKTNRINSLPHYRILRTYLKLCYCFLKAPVSEETQFFLKNLYARNAPKIVKLSTEIMLCAIASFFWLIFFFKRIFNNRKCFGFLSEEFFSNNFLSNKLCDIGGFGMTTTIISEYYSDKHSMRFKAAALFTKTIYKQKEWRFRVNDSLIFSIPDLSKNYIQSFLKYSFYAQKNLDFLLSVDIYPAYEFSLNAIPYTPLLIWLRDPKGEDELRKIATLDLELRAKKMKSLDEFISYAKKERDLFSKIHEQSKSFKRQIAFVTNAHCLTPRAKGLYNLRELKPYFLPNPIHYPSIERIQKSKHPTVCLLGRLDPVKRPWIFFELAKKFKNVEFLVCGEPSYPNLQIMNPIIKQYRAVENLKFLGLVQGEEKAEILSKSWILINTSIHEGLPCSFLESFAYGTPIVSSVNPDDLVSKFGFYTGEGIGDGTDEHTMKMFQDGMDKSISDKNRLEQIGLESRKYIEKIYNFEQFEKGLKNILSDRFRTNYVAYV